MMSRRFFTSLLGAGLATGTLAGFGKKLLADETGSVTPFPSPSKRPSMPTAENNAPLPEKRAPFSLAPLPYDKAALEPYVSARTFEFHHGKHHATYVETLNKLIEGTPYKDMSLTAIIEESAKNAKDAGIFNNAAQVWNHDFFWRSMTPGGGGAPKGKLADKINASFGSFDAFREKFIDAGIKRFGSGWAWLIQDGKGGLDIVSTPNADLPLVHGQKAILTADVWEHAYYLDYQNKRKDFLTTFVDHLANWEFAAANDAA
jgi:Fe-Mn family superoxide dismutase